MPTSNEISRRQFIQLAGVTATTALLAARKPIAVPTATTPARIPALIKPRKVTTQIVGWCPAASS